MSLAPGTLAPRWAVACAICATEVDLGGRASGRDAARAARQDGWQLVAFASGVLWTCGNCAPAAPSRETTDSRA